MSHCRECHTTIQFGRTPNGKPMPLDLTTYDHDDQAANVAIHRDATGQLCARVLRDGEDPKPYERRAMPHFATCKPYIAQQKAGRDARAGRIPNVIPLKSRARR